MQLRRCWLGNNSLDSSHAGFWLDGSRLAANAHDRQAHAQQLKVRVPGRLIPDLTSSALHKGENEVIRGDCSGRRIHCLSYQIKFLDRGAGRIECRLSRVHGGSLHNHE